MMMLGFTLLYLHLSPEFRQDVNQVRQLRLSQETKFQLTISSTPLIAAILIGVFFAEKRCTRNSNRNSTQRQLQTEPKYLPLEIFKCCSRNLLGRTFGGGGEGLSG